MQSVPVVLLLLVACGEPPSSSEQLDAGVDAGDAGPDAAGPREAGAVIGHLATKYTITNVASAADDSVFVLTSSSFARLGADLALDPSIDPDAPIGNYDSVVRAQAGRWLLSDGPSLLRRNADYSADATWNATALGSLYSASVAPAPDGSVFVVGTRRVGSDDQIVVRKLDSAGAAVTTFGVAGEAVTPSALDLRGSGLRVLPDGRLIVRADDGFTPAIVRFSADGTFEASVVLTELGPRYGRAEVIDAQGGILVLGMSSGAIQIARLTSELVLDPAFGTGGIATFDRSRPLSPAYDEFVEARAMALQADGKIVIGANYKFDDGEDDIYEEQSVLVVRFTSTGAIDPSFGTNGAVRVPLAAGDLPSTLAYTFGLATAGEHIVLGGDVREGTMTKGALTMLWQ